MMTRSCEARVPLVTPKFSVKRYRNFFLLKFHGARKLINASCPSRDPSRRCTHQKEKSLKIESAGAILLLQCSACTRVRTMRTGK